MGRPKKLTIEVSQESYNYAEMLVHEFPMLREKCKSYEKTHRELLRRLQLEDVYNPDGFAADEIFYRSKVPNENQQMELDEYLDAKKKVFFILHTIQYMIGDEQTKEVAQKNIIDGEPVQFITVCVKDRILSERTIAREKTRAITILANYIDSYVQWEVEQCFVLRDGSWGCRRPEDWMAS